MQNLTDKDIKTIKELLKAHHRECLLGLTQEEIFSLRANRFTPEEVNILKKCVKALDRSANIVGYVIVMALVTGAIVIFTKGFWISVFESVKNVPIK
jgi:hypothetical protein